MIVRSAGVRDNGLIINENGEALTHSHVFNSKEVAAFYKHRYNMGSGPITLTSANESALYYFKNTGEYDFVITNVIANLGASTGGSGHAQVKVYFNPTAGTLISGASAASDPNNFYIGSTNELSGVYYKGAEGSTITTPSSAAITVFDSVGEQSNTPVDGIFVPKGRSIGVSIVPPASNTSMVVAIALAGYYRHPDLGTHK